VTGGLRDRLAGETVIAGGIEKAFHDGGHFHFAPPAAVYTPAIAPSGATFVTLYEGPQRCGDRLAELRSRRQAPDALRENARLSELGRERALSELPISLPIGGELRHDPSWGSKQNATAWTSLAGRAGISMTTRRSSHPEGALAVSGPTACA
jgi:hypothetical protein